MIRAMIFDLDGTLVQTERLKALSYARALQSLSPEPPADEAVLEAFKDVVGRSREEVSGGLLAAFQLEPAARARLAELQVQYPWQVLARLRLEIYAAMLDDPELLRVNQWPQNVELLRLARRMNCRTALASMSDCEQVKQVLQAIGLDNEFEVILAREDVERPKPDPEIYLLAARQLAVPPGDSLVIEDSPAGVQAALAAGMRCVAVSTPLTRERLHAQQLLAPQWIVDDPATLLAVVEHALRAPAESFGAME
jgi:beta-phosphoglucomutase